jgi:hypothetical protein
MNYGFIVFSVNLPVGRQGRVSVHNTTKMNTTETIVQSGIQRISFVEEITINQIRKT